MNNTLRKAIPFLVAARAIIVLNLAVIAFHVLVLVKMIPYDVVWGGRIKSEKEMYVFETTSILINLVLIFTVLTKMKSISTYRFQKSITGMLWIFVIVFTLNTIGNLMAKTSTETYVATPLTFVLAILCWRVAIEGTGKTNARYGLKESSARCAEIDITT